MLPVEKFARFASPAAEPASMMYALGAPPLAGGDQASVTVDPLEDVARPVGGPGGCNVGVGVLPDG